MPVLFLAGGAGFAMAGMLRDDLSGHDRQRVMDVIRPATDFTHAEAYEAMPGGAATAAASAKRDALARPSSHLDAAAKHDFVLGEALFGKLWVAAPSSTLASDGLGPLYNARSCQSCHLHGGRGHPAEDGDATSMVLRLARATETEAEKAAIALHKILNYPDPVYGRQLQDRAIPGLTAEGQVGVDYTTETVTLPGGETVELRKPVYRIDALAYGPLDPATTISLRMAQPMTGLGLIETIHPADILALADPDDADGDGISGRAAWVRDMKTGETALGRFGWKAQAATLADQAATAFADDLGISTPLDNRPQGDCTQRQTDCLARPSGVQANLGPAEAPDPVLALTLAYVRHLAPPARRGPGDATVLHGKRMFYESGCTTCHRPKFVTRRDADDPSLAFQLIWAYSDFLLHDMGDGLADGQSVGEASGREWRTPPLWGTGSAIRATGSAFFLHDGRARTLNEAILWHGGEAASARNSFAMMSRDDRDALITFLESL